MTRNQIEYIKTRNQRFKDQMDLENVRRNIAETNRHNIAQESETTRHNMAGEGSVALQTAINARNAAEIARSNRMRESQTGQQINETIRSNLAREGEIRRSNRAQETIGIMNAQTGVQNAATNMRNADTRSYEAGLSANKFLVDQQLAEVEKQKRKQEIAESQSRQKYYDTQSSTGVTSRALSDTARALGDIMKIASLLGG